MVGIMTFHRALNYGAVLQAFALRRSFENVGCEAEVIDYRCDVLENPYRFESFWQRSGLKQKCKWLLQRRYEMEKRLSFDQFRRDYLNVSEVAYHRNDIAKTNNCYDLLVCGSDQVWNPNAHEFDGSYLLDFTPPKKKMSYAASFGVAELPQGLKRRYRELLDGFNTCSVRERQGLSILEDLGVSSGRIDVDPTLLMTKDDWLSEIETIQPQKPHIFAYYFELSDTFKSFVENLSRETGLPVMLMGKPFKKPFNCEVVYPGSFGPISFLEALSTARYVITNSFHGTALSIVFNCPLFIDMRHKGASVNSRIENIVEQYGLEHRIIRDGMSVADYGSIDWNAVNVLKETERARSLEYIEGSLK